MPERRGSAQSTADSAALVPLFVRSGADRGGSAAIQAIRSHVSGDGGWPCGRRAHRAWVRQHPLGRAPDAGVLLSWENGHLLPAGLGSWSSSVASTRPALPDERRACDPRPSTRRSRRRRRTSSGSASSARAAAPSRPAMPSEFTIMSVSKPFVFALVCRRLGPDAVRDRIGVNSTGLPFNSLAAVERTATTAARTDHGQLRGRSPRPACPRLGLHRHAAGRRAAGNFATVGKWSPSTTSGLIRTDFPVAHTCAAGVVNNVFQPGRKAFEVGVDPTEVPTMPIEFSVAAFRLGHSMVRRAYNWRTRCRLDRLRHARPALHLLGDRRQPGRRDAAAGAGSRTSGASTTLGRPTGPTSSCRRANSTTPCASTQRSSTP